MINIAILNAQVCLIYLNNNIKGLDIDWKLLEKNECWLLAVELNCSKCNLETGNKEKTEEAMNILKFAEMENGLFTVEWMPDGFCFFHAIWENLKLFHILCCL